MSDDLLLRDTAGGRSAMSSGDQSEIGPPVRDTMRLVRWILPASAVALLLGLTLVMWRHELRQIEAAGSRELEHWLYDQTHELRREFETCEGVLWAAAGLAGGSARITRPQWADFVRDVEIASSPGVLGLALVDRVPEAHLEWYLGAVRRHVGADFDRIVPSGADGCRVPGWHFIIRYHEPEAVNRVAWGLDISDQPVSRDAYVDSWATGRVRLSEPFELQQGQTGKTGVVLVAPVGDRADRGVTQRPISAGWVSMPIDLDTFFRSAFRTADPIGELVVRDAETGRVLRGGTDGWVPERPADLDATIDLDGRAWELCVWRTTPLDFTHATTILFGGFTGSVLVGWMFWSVGRSRQRAIGLAERMTADLRRSEASQRELAERAESASRMKSLFLANMSHDIRTPMTAILGYAELLESRIGPEARQEAGEALSAIRRSGRHLVGLINNILDVSKIEAGRLELRSDEVDLGEAIAGCVEIVVGEMRGRGVALSVSIDERLPARIAGDETRLRQILLNLLGNAAKFTLRGSVVLRVSGVDEEERRGLLVVVEDTGIGMDRATLARAVEPFRQGDASHTRRFEGSGLGLTIVHGLVHAMGGWISLDSTGGAGSRVEVWLPVRAIGDGVIGDWAARVRPVGGGARSGSTDREGTIATGVPRGAGGRVLVVEDGPDNQRLIRTLLERAGHEVELAADGVEGIERIRRSLGSGSGFEVVLLDMQLPGKDGYTVVREARAMGLRVPVVALTAHAMAGDRERCMEAGCDGYIAKPFECAELVHSVGVWAERHRGRGEAA